MSEQKPIVNWLRNLTCQGLQGISVIVGSILLVILLMLLGAFMFRLHNTYYAKPKVESGVREFIGTVNQAKAINASMSVKLAPPDLSSRLPQIFCENYTLSKPDCYIDGSAYVDVTFGDGQMLIFGLRNDGLFGLFFGDYFVETVNEPKTLTPK